MEPNDYKIINQPDATRVANPIFIEQPREKINFPTSPEPGYEELKYNYIKAVENPDSIGWDEKAQVWRQPKQKYTRKGKPIYDTNQIAVGLDVTTNKYVIQFFKNNNRLSDKYLTDPEARELFNKSSKYYEQIINNYASDLGITQQLKDPRIRTQLFGLVYHGFGKTVFKQKTQNAANIISAVRTGDYNKVHDAIGKFYSNSKYKERARLHQSFKFSKGGRILLYHRPIPIN